MLWCKVKCDDSDPRLVRAGFLGGVIFRCLERINGQMEYAFEIPERDLDPSLLAHRLCCTEAQAAEGLAACIREGLVTGPRNGCYALSDALRNAPRTAAQRMRDYRERKASGITGDVTRVTESNVTRYGEQRNVVTPSRVEQSRAEQSRAVEASAAAAASADNGPAEPVLQKPPRKVADSRHAQTVSLWCRLWTELHGGVYAVQGAKDGSAVSRLMKFDGATDAEIEARIRRAFADAWFREHADLALFVSQWNRHGTPTAPAPKPQKDPRVGRLAAEDFDWTNEPVGDVTNEF